MREHRFRTIVPYSRIDNRRICFKAWLAKRGSAGEHEVEAGIRQVIAFVEAHGSSRFELIDGGERVEPRSQGYRKNIRKANTVALVTLVTQN